MDMIASLESVHGERSGVPRLRMNVHVKSNLDRMITCADVVAEVRAGATIHSQNTGSAYFLGYAMLESAPGQFHGAGAEGRWDFCLPLLPYHLRQIEEARGKGDLYLFVYFRCHAFEMDTSSAPQPVRFVSPSVGGSTTSSSYVPFKIAWSDWLTTLKALGYREYCLIEVPVGVLQKRALTKALTHMEAARDHFDEGKDEECLVSCYKAFEFLAKQKQVKQPDQNAFERLLDGVPDANKRRALKQLMDYLCRFLNVARHEPGQEKVHVDRRDSEYGLILSQATLAYLAKTMARRNSKEDEAATEKRQIARSVEE